MEINEESSGQPRPARILIIEDDENTQSFLSQGLKEAGYDVELAETVQAATLLCLKESFQLLILDIMLPDGDGLSFCKEVRKRDTHLPILFLTAIGGSEDIAAGLDTGGDDYLVKPFKFVELLARVRTLLRRSRLTTIPAASEQLMVFSDVVVDDYRKTVRRGSATIILTSTEFKLLSMFMKNPHKVISRTEILNEIWGADIYIGSNVVDVYINYLRKKLETGGMQRLIHTVIGMGYVLKETDEN